MSIPDLFTPIRLGELELRNRIVMAPLTRGRAAEGNVPSSLAVTYYTQRAGAGLIVSEASQILQEGQAYPRAPGIHTDAQVAGWRRVTDAVHAQGGQIVLQLWHTGRNSHPVYQEDGGLPVAPSAVNAGGITLGRNNEKLDRVTPRALETEEVVQRVEAFAAAAARAKQAGFDGVEIHGANGYLIDQFLRDGSNLRTDRYGGSIENRARFLFEVTEAVIDAWGGSGRVGLRLSPAGEHNGQYDSNPTAVFTHVAERLNRYDLAFLHVIEPALEGHRMGPPPGKPRVAPTLRRIYTGPMILNGAFDKASATAALADGSADAVAFGTPFIANPDLVERFRRDLPLAEADSSTFYTDGPKGYIDYPSFEDSLPQAWSTAQVA
ncbi:alkene reductase [Indioceanicola profundi]|uniref:alkene reductase n=1 Tax=Indioceanicola profundi TaxID=2220096 RepID=UPI000E6AD116|nr:alkene reductase [Indioceanicola profundi]